ncbi:hypothetical protein HWB76_gp047 [Streptomyces phage Blueeyedbeauty]|uniref:Uncharacterized protein n=1 Tax=Streptomyces phage Blueeyedbeauty TaxID=2250336 RepID=A0A345L251_9CAUD|nr:hypothetical protein HWB76_gp047 [Streptomyces phage Blueeyedbeauty]AXH49353.1 hypothetical protein SEA_BLUEEYEDBEAUTY_246 [Streptomyces phage Blueeyedbeauty]
MRLKEVDLTGWKFETEKHMGFRVMGQNQYWCYVTKPDGERLKFVSFQFGLMVNDHLSTYAWTDKGAERKFIKRVRKMVRDDIVEAESKTTKTL